jgi:hypothetical protein
MTAPQLALRTLRTTHTLFLLSILFYAFLGERLMQRPAAYRGSRMLIVTMAMLAVALAGAAAILRGRTVTPSADTLRRDPQDLPALKRWQMGSLTSLAICESVALCGLALRARGAALNVVLPFYLAGFVLMLAWRPRLDLSSTGPE